MGHARLVAEGAGRFDRSHGDEGQQYITANEEAQIAVLALSKLNTRLMEDHEGVYDLLAGIDSTEIDPSIHRILTNEEGARKALVAAFPMGLPPAVQGLMEAVHHITETIRKEAKVVLLGECTDEAAAEVLGVDA